MPRKNQNARRKWTPNPEHYMIEFGTPTTVGPSQHKADDDLGFLLWIYGVLVAYFFVADVVAMVEVAMAC